MAIPTEPIGSMPQSEALLDVIARDSGLGSHLGSPVGSPADPAVMALFEAAIVVSPIGPRVESAEEARDRVLEAAQFIPLGQLGTTDDCGFAPFCDDRSTTRDVAFQKVAARVAGTQLAARMLLGAV